MSYKTKYVCLCVNYGYCMPISAVYEYEQCFSAPCVFALFPRIDVEFEMFFTYKLANLHPQTKDIGLLPKLPAVEDQAGGGFKPTGK